MLLNSLLDNYVHFGTGLGCSMVHWSKKRSRIFHRIMSGLYFHRDEKLRFMTLTTGVEMERSIEDAFKVLYKRLIRVRPIDYLNEGYLSYDAMSHLFGDDVSVWFEKCDRFIYAKVKTSEGQQGVIHLLYYGSYYPNTWLSDNWLEITSCAFVVDVRMCYSKPYDVENLASYCVNQYVVGQESLLSFSTSKGWCPRGYIKMWKQLKHGHKYVLEKPYEVNGYTIYKWLDRKALINEYHSWLDAMAGRGVGQLSLLDYGLER